MDDKEKTLENEQKEEYVFVKEQTKTKPFNKRKLAKSTLISAVSALVFGLVACVTFFFLAPLVSNVFEKEEEPPENPIAPVVFPEETIEEEMTPQDMLITSEPEINLDEFAENEQKEVMKLINSIKFDLADYEELYVSLNEIAHEAEKCLVRVRTVKNDTDWFNNLYQETGETTGIIMADNGTYLYILTYASDVKSADELYVTFVNGVSVKASFINEDIKTDICVLSVLREDVSEETLESLKVASLGMSGSSSLSGTLVLAVGSPMGTYGSVNYGMITSSDTEIIIPDNRYRQLTTDIVGSTKSNGVIVNLKGDVLGIIDVKFRNKDTGNLISAIGISEIKKTIANLINEKPLMYFGVTGANVPEEAVKEYHAPKGVFVLSVEANSPAGVGGIQAGDIITEINGKTIDTYIVLVSEIKDMVPDEPVEVTIKRESPEGYKELLFTVVPKGYNTLQ